MALKLSCSFYNFVINKVFFIKWGIKDLLPIILQEVVTKNVLMFAWFSNYSILKTLSYCLMYYFSRSKFNFWLKGLKSYNFQTFRYFFVDCDMDCGLFKIIQFNNKSCHTYNNNCFFNKYN